MQPAIPKTYHEFLRYLFSKEKNGIKIKKGETVCLITNPCVSKEKKSAKIDSLIEKEFCMRKKGRVFNENLS